MPIWRKGIHSNDEPMTKLPKVGEPMHRLYVKDADELWAALQWLYPRTHDISTHPWSSCVTKPVTVEQITYPETQFTVQEGIDNGPSYAVVFPEYIWQKALKAKADNSAERKLRKEIFG